MASQQLKNIFLSASIPDIPGDRYSNTADFIAIRDSVRALATIVMPEYRLIWGGHPSITPLITYVLRFLNLNLNNHVTLYQSSSFAGQFPDENVEIENIVIVDRKKSISESIKVMRQQMINDNLYVAGIFIGGMDGVIEEYKIFKDRHPNSIVLPIASTGGAARIIYENFETSLSPRLKYDYAYMSLFRDLLIEKVDII